MPRPSASALRRRLVGALCAGPASAATLNVTKTAVAKEATVGLAVAGAWDDATAGWATSYTDTGRPVEEGDVWDGGVAATPAQQWEIPERLTLHTARPNPFASRTALGYDLLAAGAVRIAVYDVLGREVAVLVDREVEAGRHEAVLDGRALPSGAYVVRLEARGHVESRRLTLVR